MKIELNELNELRIMYDECFKAGIKMSAPLLKHQSDTELLLHRSSIIDCYLHLIMIKSGLSKYEIISRLLDRISDEVMFEKLILPTSDDDRHKMIIIKNKSTTHK